MELGLIILVLGMGIYIYCRGIVKMILTLFVVIVAMIITYFVAPTISHHIVKQTVIEERLTEYIVNETETRIENKLDILRADKVSSEKQIAILQELPLNEMLPDDILGEIIEVENVNLTIEEFILKIANLIAIWIISCMMYIVVFILCYIGVKRLYNRYRSKILKII